jgi:two-component system response regulator
MPLHPLNILVIEDNPGDVALIREAFMHHGFPYTLEVFNDGQVALDFFHTLAAQDDAPCPDLILLDFTLPRIDGQTVLQYIKSFSPCAAICTVVLSGLDIPAHRAEAMQLHADAYCLKPNTLEEWEELGIRLTSLWHDRQAMG